MQRTLIVLLFVFASANLSLAQSASPTDTPEPTQDATAFVTDYGPFRGAPTPHPDFILPSIEGDKPIQLSSFRGKKVLILHFASW